MSTKSRKVLIIGAGPVGLMFLKTILDDGHNVICFEKNDKVGGMWNVDNGNIKNGYVDLDEEGGVEATYNELQRNTSKYTDYASFHTDDGLIDPDNHFLRRQGYLEWLQRSVVKFNLITSIKFNTEVTKLNKEKNGWSVNFKNHDGQHREEKFDFVISCIGDRFPTLPNVGGLDRFEGIGIHSSQIRNEEDLFSSKTVLVIGGRHSGTDMAFWALKKKAKKVFLSLDKGGTRNYWLLQRLSKENSLPWEFYFNRYICFDRLDLFEQEVNSHVVPLYKCSDAAVNLEIDRSAMHDDTPFLFEQMALGNLELVDYIDSMTETGAKCKDGSIINGIDVAVYATGFLQKYPWISHLWDDEKQMKNELYNFILPVENNLQGLAITCNFEGISSYSAIYELLARWLCDFWLTRDYTESGSLYSHAEIQAMKEAIEEYKAPRHPSLRFYRVVDFYILADSLAKDVGCLPPHYKELLKAGSRNDVELGIALMYLPVHMAMQYRLRGKGMFEDARQFVINFTKYVIGEEKFEKLV